MKVLIYKIKICFINDKTFYKDYLPPAKEKNPTCKIIDTFASINVLILDIKQFEKISKALADTTRLQILRDMAKRKGCIQCSEIITLTKLAQPSVSHHVKTLIEAGLIHAEKDGRNHSYNLNKSLLKAYSGWINEVAV